MLPHRSGKIHKIWAWVWLAIIMCILFVTLLLPSTLGHEFVVPKMSAHEEKHNTNIHDESGKLYNETISSLCFIIPLYSKINESDLFKNATRANIYALIINKPGITFSSITRELKLENGTATHHIYILEREGYIKSKKTGKYRRYYQTGFKASGLNDIQDKIVSAIVENPGISQTEIAIKLDLSRQVVNFHLKGLISMEAIKLEKNGNKSNCFINNKYHKD